MRIKWEAAHSVIEPRINAEGTHVFPFDEAFPVDVRFLKFGRRNDVRLNRHDYFEILFLRSGEVVYEVQDRSLTMRRGDLFVVGSMPRHRMSVYRRSPVKGIALYFLPDIIRGTGTTGDDILYLMPFLMQDRGFPHVIPARTGIPRKVLDLMMLTRAELPASSQRARLAARTCLKMILILLGKYYSAYRGSEEVYFRKQRDLDRLRPLFEFIDANYADVITVEHAAAALHMSKSNFMRFFRNATGQPFVAYLNHFRIAKAEHMLRTTDKPIAVVSQEVGFCDQSYFCLVFRRVLGVTPRDYRRQAEGVAVPRAAARTAAPKP